MRQLEATRPEIVEVEVLGSSPLAPVVKPTPPNNPAIRPLNINIVITGDAAPCPQLTELLAGICVVAILVICVGYVTAFSYRWLQSTAIHQGR